MDEEQTTEENTSEKPEENSNAGKSDNTTDEGKGNESKGNSLIVNAEKIAERIETANAKLEKNLKKYETAMAETILAGRSDGAGVEKPKEETSEEYAQKVISGELNEERRT